MGDKLGEAIKTRMKTEKREKCARPACSLDGLYLFSPYTASVSLGLKVFWSLGTR